MACTTSSLYQTSLRDIGLTDKEIRRLQYRPWRRWWANWWRGWEFTGPLSLALMAGDLPALSRNSRSLASSHRLGSGRLMFELPSCAYLAILRAPSLPNCDSCQRPHHQDIA